MPKPKLTIRMFGGLRLSSNGDAPTELGGQQTGSLLAYLALNLDRNCTRDEVLAKLWPEEEEEDARHRLRQSLYSLRKCLDGPPFECADSLFANRTSLRLGAEFVWTDVSEFERSLIEATRAQGHKDRLLLLAQAIALYSGPLLPGYYQDCFTSEQNRLSELYLSGLHALILAYEQAGDVDSAIDHARRAIALDPLIEETHCSLMRLYAAKGQPSAVLRQYQELERVLKEELGEAPSETTRQLMEALRESGLSQVAAHPATGNGNGYADRAGYQTDYPSTSAPIPLRRSFGYSLVRAVLVAAVGLAALSIWNRNHAPPNPARLGSMAAALAAGPKHVIWTAQLPFEEVKIDSDPTSMSLDNAGNIYVAGLFRSKDHDTDFVTAKFDKDGRFLWRKRYNGPGNDLDRARSVVWSTGNDAVYVCGESDNGKGNGKTRLCGLDYAVVKYDTDGNEQWARRYNGEADGEDWAIKVGSDLQKNCYVTGWSSGGPDRLHPHDGVVTIKYDPNGKVVWKRWFDGGSGQNTHPYDMAVDQFGSVWITGFTHYNNRPGTTYEYFLLRYDTTGKELWDRSFDASSNGDDFGRWLSFDASYNAIVTGRGYNILSPVTAGAPDFSTVVFDWQGNLRFSRRYSGDSGLTNSARAATADYSGNIYVTGESLAAAGDYDIVTVKYDAKGNEKWVKRFKGAANKDDGPLGIVSEGDGNVYLTGFSTPVLTISDPRFGEDFVTLKYNKDGDLLWAHNFDGGTHTFERASAILLDSATRSIVVTGQAASATSRDITVIKYDIK